MNYSNSILRIVNMQITIMQTINVAIDSSIAFQKLSSTYQMYSQKGGNKHSIFLSFAKLRNQSIIWSAVHRHKSIEKD